MWFDTHCHLYDLEEPAAAVTRAREAGVEGIVVVAVDGDTARQAIELAGIEGVYAGVAVHPTSTKDWDDSWADPIDELLASPEVVAVGESGVDLYWDTSFFDDQRRALIKHIQLAKKHDKALVLHTRDSVDETIEILREAGPPERSIFHCWSGSPDQVAAVVALGGYVSFAGNVSFAKAEDLREAARAVPADRLLVETDAPYLAPVPKRGKKNEPAFVVHTGKAVAEARAEPVEVVAATTTANARAVFGLG